MPVLNDTAYPVAIDGLQVTGGSQSDFPGNVNVLTGGVTTPYGATGALVTQGGGIYLHNNNRSVRITDNVIVGNSGSYGGGIRVGTPYTGDNRNYDALIADNQVLNNGGTNLAGGIGLFTGSDGYKVRHNAICGNFSAEYGGAMTAFGYMSNAGGSNGGTIAGNTIWFNSSYDEGGAVMLAGELPATPTGLSPGTGAATIDANVIDANLASDDGGGIRLLQVSGSHVTKADPQTIAITNNTITNNVSAHEGGGIALDDAPFVTIVDNTVAGNMTTATAVTSDGLPAPAGLATGPNSDPLMARLSSSGSLTAFSLVRTVNGQSTFSKPVLLDNVFNDNRAGTYVGGYVYGIGGTLPDGSDNSVDPWDMGVVGDPGLLHPVGRRPPDDDGHRRRRQRDRHRHGRVQGPDARSSAVTVLAVAHLPGLPGGGHRHGPAAPAAARGLPPHGDGLRGLRSRRSEHSGDPRQPDAVQRHGPVERHRQRRRRVTSTTRPGRPWSPRPGATTRDPTSSTRDPQTGPRGTPDSHWHPPGPGGPPHPPHHHHTPPTTPSPSSGPAGPTSGAPHDRRITLRSARARGARPAGRDAGWGGRRRQRLPRLATQLRAAGRATHGRAAAGAGPAKSVHLAGTDGWVSMPAGSPDDLPFFPDSLAPPRLRHLRLRLPRRHVDDDGPGGRGRARQGADLGARCSPSTRATR